jgi:type IV secretory pathway VirB2 component (pilin)
MGNRFMIALCAFSLALTLGTVTHAAQSTLAQVYNGGGLEAGVGAAASVQGPLKTTIDVATVNVVNTILNYVALAAVVAIIIAGLYMILTGGSQADKAKTIIIWTIVGLIVILLAKVIVNFVFGIFGANGGNVGINVLSGSNPVQVVIQIVNTVLTYVGLAAVIAIVIAGLYMILSGGSQADKAKEIIKWVIIGLVVILLAKVIVAFIYAALGENLADIGINIPGGTGDIRQVITSVLNTVLNFVGLIAVIAIVIAGIWLIVGMGSDESKDRAKKIILYTIIGLIIILLAKLLVNLPIILIGN